MGIRGSECPFIDLIEKVRSWFTSMSGFYCDCRSLVPGPTYGHRCRNCGRLFCSNCMHGGLDVPKLCKLCFQAFSSSSGNLEDSALSRFQSSKFAHLEELSNFSSSPRSSRSGDDEDGDDSGKQFFNLRSESSHNISDVDSVSVSSRFKSVNSSPLDSPSRGGEVDREGEDLLENSSHDSGYDSLSVYRNHESQKVQTPLDFENNRLIWDPPLPEDENDDLETEFFADDDEDDNIGDSSAVFSSGSFSSHSLSIQVKPSDTHKEQLRSAVDRHFKALVSQLLKGEGLQIGCESGGNGWLDIVSSLAWQAATFVKPDTSKGSSMDPGNYVKVKCILSGTPINSTLIKGVVCTKNVKHKRMISQHRKPRIFLLGGALEYQRVSNKLASINTVLQQENDHLKVSISKIEAHRPNVLLVEKSVSPYAQEYLLTKEISLVLNVKRTLLERIARCTGAKIAPSIDNIVSARLGNCEMFRVEKFFEECSSSSQPNKKSIKTLMFFDGCPRRSGCTVLLHGKNREELKKVKHVVQYASFAAYHLSRETSFLADEGASLPNTPLNPSLTSSAHNSANQIVAEHRRHSSCSNDSSICLFQCSNVPSLQRDSSQSSGEETCEPSEFLVNVRVPDEEMNTPLEERTNLEVQEEFGAANESEASDCYSADSHSILVSLSTTCVLKGTLCEPSQLIRIKFYGSFDKPLGRYLRDDLFDQTSYCHTCKEPAEAHVRCYTHQHGSLTISVRRHSSIKLPGERDGRIWMWHRCLKCEQSDGVPPAARRVIMSDAAWGLSFGKFLELSFSNHATANRVASCGHSLQKDCLRFYGCGNMVAFFRYSPVDILSVHLPPLVLDFTCDMQQEWAKREAAEFSSKVEFLHMEVANVLQGIEQKITTSEHEPVKTSIHRYIMDLKELLNRERNEYEVLLQPEESSPFQGTLDILELNRLKRCLLIDSQTWDRRLCLLDSFSKSNPTSKLLPKGYQIATHSNLKEWQDEPKKHHEGINLHALESNLNMVEMDLSIESVECYGGTASFNLISSQYNQEDDENIGNSSLERVPSAASTLSDKIDSLWSGNPNVDGIGSISLMDNPLYRKVVSPLRVNSFDSALRFRDRLRGPSSSLHLTSVRSFDAAGDSASLDYLQKSPTSGKRSDLAPSHNPVFISPASHMVGDGARVLLQTGHDDLVIVLYENEPSTIISYAISSQDHTDFISSNHQFNEEAIGRPSMSQFHSDEEFQKLGSNYYLDHKETHFKFSFDDESSIPTDKVKFSVTCYYAKQFHRLRKKCCPIEADFLRSLSRCKRWNAQGGKSNVYFAKSFDERFIIKQVTKTELDSFELFAPEYFKYITESINTGSPTCLAKVFGIFQVTVRHLKGGREVKRDLMVMENLFFGRTLSKIYDLKGSSRARYNPDTSGNDKVLLDLNLLESLRTKPIFLGSKAKRRLERAVWNDTSFLAAIYVMDYSLLVGIDDERKELVIGIIDFMRQYTWDKHLETWVKASGILGGPKNASPTVVSPLQYKKRFRKAMSKYFLTVPDQWSSP